MQVAWKIEIEERMKEIKKLLSNDFSLCIEEGETSSCYPVISARDNRNIPICSFEATIFMANGTDNIGQIEMSSISNNRAILNLHGDSSGPFTWKSITGEIVDFQKMVNTFVFNAKNYADKM